MQLGIHQGLRWVTTRHTHAGDAPHKSGHREKTSKPERTYCVRLFPWWFIYTNQKALLHQPGLDHHPDKLGVRGASDFLVIISVDIIWSAEAELQLILQVRRTQNLQLHHHHHRASWTFCRLWYWTFPTETSLFKQGNSAFYLSWSSGSMRRVLHG